MAEQDQAPGNTAPPADEPVISEEEANALLTPAPHSGRVQPFDLCAGGLRISRGRLPTLELLHEDFSKRLRPAMSQVLKREPVVTFLGVHPQKTSEYLASLAENPLLGIFSAKPLPGQVLMALDSNLIFLMVDTFYGGTGRLTEREKDKPLTPTELRLGQMVMRLAAAELAGAWAPIAQLEFEWVRHETNIHFVNVSAPADTMLVNRFTIELPTGTGSLDFVMPPAFVEPVRELLAATGIQGPATKQGAWTQIISAALENALIEMRTVMTEVEISLGDLIRLKPGDVVPIEPPREVSLLAADVELFKARFGVSRRRNAVCCERMVLGEERQRRSRQS